MYMKTVMAVIFGDLKLGNLWHSDSEIFRLLVSHASRYPLMEIQDAYKMLYQGSLGSEHITHSFEDFESELREEWELVERDNNIPMWENIHPDGQIVRVYLAPFKARGGQVDQLATLCYWSASLFKMDIDDLKSNWDTLVKTCRDKKWYKFPQDDVEEFDRWLRKYQFPPVHHTESYRKAYKPSYRLLLREFLGALKTE